MALAYTAPAWTNGSGTGISASQLQAISNCIEGLVQGTDKAIHNIAMNGNTMTLTYADGSVDTITVSGFKSIVSITKTSTVGNVDTYTITYTDGTTSTFTVTNANYADMVGATSGTNGVHGLVPAPAAGAQDMVLTGGGTWADRMTTDGSNAASEVEFPGAFTVGVRTGTVGTNSTAEGLNVKATGDCSHAEGELTEATGDYSHAEGLNSKASKSYAHAEGHSTIASGINAHAEGEGSTASETNAHAEGNFTTASGNGSHAEGNRSMAIGDYSHAEGNRSIATGDYSHAEGNEANASGESSHAEGEGTTALGNYSHAEGYRTSAKNSHAEGSESEAEGIGSHAEGVQTLALEGSHAEGYNTKAMSFYSHSEGKGTRADSSYQHVQGKYNIIDNSNTYADIVGGGLDGDNRANIETLDWSGNLWVAGKASDGGGKLGNESLLTDAYNAATTYGPIGNANNYPSWCIDGNVLYKNISQCVGVQPPNVTYWEATDVTSELSALNNSLTGVSHVSVTVLSSYVIDFYKFNNGLKMLVANIQLPQTTSGVLCALPTGYETQTYVNAHMGDHNFASRRAYVYLDDQSLHVDAGSDYGLYGSIIYY